MKTKIFAVVAVIISLIGGYILATKTYKTAEQNSLAEIDQTIFLRDYAPRMGATNPKVYLVEFFDPECESCRAFYPHVKEILKEYEGQIQLVLRYAPFHPNAMMVARILEAARKQNRYFEALEILYQHQPEWGDHHHPRPELVWTYLAQIDVDVEKIKKDMNDPAIISRIEQDVKDLETLKIRGTPTFFVNGRPLSTFGLGPLKDLIKEEINK